MPQQLHVLRCYSCKMHQVHIVKKVAKWQCKICNEKQMTQVVYFRGTGAECRKYVQAQNLENAGEKELAVIDAWGFDCEAEQDSGDPCDCSDRKSAADKLSSFLTNGDFEKENSALSQNSPKRQKLNCGGKQPSSLPSRHLQQYSNTRRCKSGSYPAADKETRLPNKYDKFLAPRSVSEAPGEENETRTNKWQRLLDSMEKSGADGCGNMSRSLSTSGGAGNSPERCANELEFEEQETETPGALICSQVDESSESSRSSKANVVNYMFEDADDDLDFELDF